MTVEYRVVPVEPGTRDERITTLRGLLLKGARRLALNSHSSPHDDPRSAQSLATFKDA